MKAVSIATAKNQLPELVHQVEKGQPLRLNRRGQPVAVLLSEFDYQRLLKAAATRADFASWAQSWRTQLPPGFEGISSDDLRRWRGM